MFLIPDGKGKKRKAILLAFLDSRRVYKDNTFTLQGTLFEVPVPPAGNRIRILFDPHHAELVPKIYYEGKYQGDGRIVDTYANRKVRRGELTMGQSRKQKTNTDPVVPIRDSTNIYSANN